MQVRNKRVDLQEVDSKPVYQEFVTDMYDCFSGYAMILNFGIIQTFSFYESHLCQSMNKHPPAALECQ